ncbi:MAG: organic solvent ABC transporter permease [Bdellovibrionaceae bacterium]|nr:organic solvent ABC transporter permease [Pseudobdellovibrionaceae bacterium]|tara:strand:- start:428 stop:1231 length:804 start_codon:yes stop_codon:yes gene_type:complete
MGSSILSFFEQLGKITLFWLKIHRVFFHTQGNQKAIFHQISSIAWRSLPTVLLSGLFVGAILVVQFYVMLSQYDASIYLGGLNTSTVIREVGPLLISFLLAGKIGAYTTAELGTMRVTEQIDAIECLGTQPIQYLIVPRYFAIVIATVFLLCIGMMVSILGSMSFCSLFYGINVAQFVSTIPRFTDGWTLFSGMSKGLCYGIIVASVCCYYGFYAKGGAQGVGRAVTRSAVTINFYIILTNYLMSHLLRGLQESVSTVQGWMHAIGF